MKVGDLVAVDIGAEKPFMSIITEICLPKEHSNGLHLIQVLVKDATQWYPATCIKVLNESR